MTSKAEQIKAIRGVSWDSVSPKTIDSIYNLLNLGQSSFFNPPALLEYGEYRGGSYPLGFIVWWKLYPKKRGIKETVKVWLDSKLESKSSDIVDKTQAQITLYNKIKSSGKFVPEFPDPVRYLKHERYNDELPENTKPDKQPRTMASLPKDQIQALYMDVVTGDYPDLKGLSIRDSNVRACMVSLAKQRNLID